MRIDLELPVVCVDSPGPSTQPLPPIRDAEGAPRLLLFHPGGQPEAQTLRLKLQQSGAIVGLADTLEALREHLTESSWDVVLASLESNTSAGLEALRFVQGSDLLVGRVALLGRMDAPVLAALVPLQLHALLVQPVQTAHLLQTVEQCHVMVLAQRRQEQNAAWLREQTAERKASHERLQKEMEQLEQSIVNALLDVLALRESGCIAHGLRVQAYASAFGRIVQYPQSLLPHLERAALLHDIGKIGLSDPLLFRQGALSPSELDRMQSHTTVGEQILNRIAFLRPAAQIVRHHHERFDGQGFPDRLQGEQISLGARIFAIADAWDALTSDRAYRAAQSYASALQEMARCAGGQFDPRLVGIFLQVPVATWIELRRQVESRLHPRPADPARGLQLAYA